MFQIVAGHSLDSLNCFNDLEDFVLNFRCLSVQKLFKIMFVSNDLTDSVHATKVT